MHVVRKLWDMKEQYLETRCPLLRLFFEGRAEFTEIDFVAHRKTEYFFEQSEEPRPSDQFTLKSHTESGLNGHSSESCDVRICPGFDSFTFVELFSGIGGFSLALTHLGKFCLF